LCKKINISYVPIGGGRIKRQFRCPECDRSLPIDPMTECDNCGAHLEVKVDVVAPAINQ